MLATTLFPRGFGFPVECNGSPLCALLISTRSLRLPVLIVSLQQFFNRMARSRLDLFAKRWDSAAGFISQDALDTPHGKEQIAKTYEWFIVDYRAHPIIERMQVEAAQDYSGLIDLVEHAPIFFARTV
jgi:hypothetical protein